jgi:rubrerythrin
MPLSVCPPAIAVQPRFRIARYGRGVAIVGGTRIKGIGMKSTRLRAAIAAFGVGAAALSGLAYAAGSQQTSTRQDLMDAMHGEAFATLKYMAYADAARAHGNIELADLFDTIANVERQDHFSGHAKLLGLVRSDAENLNEAIGGEAYETSTMYPQMARRAEAAGNKNIAPHFQEGGADEAKHRDAYRAALDQLPSK